MSDGNIKNYEVLDLAPLGLILESPPHTHKHTHTHTEYMARETSKGLRGKVGWQF